MKVAKAREVIQKIPDLDSLNKVAEDRKFKIWEKYLLNQEKKLKQQKINDKKKKI